MLGFAMQPYDKDESRMALRIVLDQAVTYCNKSLAEHPVFNAMINVMQDLTTPFGPPIGVFSYFANLPHLAQ